MIVIDTNVMAYFLLPAYEDKLSIELFSLAPHWLVPPLIKIEFANVLLIHLRHNIINSKAVYDTYTKFEELSHNKVRSVNRVDILKLAVESRLSVYDSEFVALAKNNKIPLITNDKKICTEFGDIAMTPSQYIYQLEN